MVRLPTYEFVDHFLNELIDVKCFKLGMGLTKTTPDKCELISAPFPWMVFSPREIPRAPTHGYLVAQAFLSLAPLLLLGFETYPTWMLRTPSGCLARFHMFLLAVKFSRFHGLGQKQFEESPSPI